MYRVVVKTRDKYNNVVPGARYCFTKRSAIDLAATFTNVECEFDVEKWTRLNKDIFCWSDSEVSEIFWDKFYKIVGKEQEEGGLTKAPDLWYNKVPNEGGRHNE